ncbi:ABC transporter ATP-binding protein [Campylobacter sp. MIT 21-1685]|uniref:ABC transporter ATP-binding protein n=1 Tax=unclassified Campylobacter TaxID=2593542 RepID=UPI00224ADAA7|nr:MULTISPECIES: ABC transporter ATP-binding protein [unclassified Campylobacter]MCX2683594.1 ABC transporter ATP-binding protein [Campylobacter sp. MIT 21-1684]MCX2751877.1 ABC transporter ATP-binding protein [Campylobacter sp. MIT 21-1682]MCX2808070.1 ABC transporter ATP-binding protein [Campylobacter sp. MIT 21-1685]
MDKQMRLREVLIRFKPFYRQYLKYFLFAFFGMLLTSIGTAGSFYAIEPIMNIVFIEKNEALLYFVPFFMVFAYFLKNAGMYLQSYYIAFIGTDILRILRARVLDNILRLDMVFFKKNRSGELISRCTNDINALQSIVSSIIPDFLREFLTAIGLLAVVVYQNPRLAFFALIILPCAVVPLVWFAKKLKKYAKNIQQSNSNLLSSLNEIFSNIELIKANNTEKKEGKKFEFHNNEICKLNLKSARVDALISPLMEMTGSLGVAVTIIIGGYEVMKGSMSVGAFFSFISALFALYNPIKRITSLYGKLQTAVVASERTFYLLDLQPQIVGGVKELQYIDKLEFKQVYFAYDEKDEVLQGFDIELAKGKSLALVGVSGAGKSSVIALILHFFEKKKGEILFNGKDINDFTLHSLRSKIALVTQDIYIFKDTVAANVAYSEEFNEKKVIQALQLANAYDFVLKIGGIYTELFEQGKNLSGGQKQRIAIARALYKEPDLLIFDEATSALDNESEKAVVATIENIKKDKLILVVAHRLSTVENADSIAVMQNGKVLALGSNDELLQSCTLYQKLKNKENSKPVFS